ncbi:MAG: aspartate aminotransferase family protein, partial [Candidatus Aminicenantes bacterium]|nr:aspartate aminotransferase family protein [Candidatus Aminicenantes bacterium]
YQYPSGSVLYRDLQHGLPLITRGRGVFLQDAEGRKYLDGSGGAAVVNIGHGVREIGEAMAAQAAKIAYVSGTKFTHYPVERLAERVASFLPFPDGKVFFLTSGSEAIEAAIKLARQYWVECGKPKKYRVISRFPSYHGNTLAALSLSARKHYQETFRPLLIQSHKIPAPYCYRCPWGLAPPACRLRCARELEKKIVKLGPESVSAFVTEVVGGSSTGASVPPPGYFEAVRAICDKHSVLLVVDEVMTGAGRTGEWLACHHFGLVPDVVVMGKGLTSGYFPLSAVAAKKELVDAIRRRGHNFLHAQTFAHHPVGCSAGLAVLDYMEKHDLLARCERAGDVLWKRLEPFLSRPHVGDIRGLGLLVGIEFVKDKKRKTPFPRGKKYVEKFMAAAIKNGLFLWPNVGHAGGADGDLVMVAPPFVIKDREIGLLRDKIASTLDEMEKMFP